MGIFCCAEYSAQVGMKGEISTKAIQDLRVALRTSFGAEFEATLTDEDLQEIGKALLVVTAEHLKIKACNS